MKRLVSLILATVLSIPLSAQIATPQTTPDPVVLTLDDALVIALSENIAVKVADKEITRAQYALKGTYASLFPQVDGSGSYQRTIKKQVMYMDFDMSSMMGGGGASGGDGETPTPAPSQDSGRPAGGGIEVGRWNTFSTGIQAAMPLVNAQLWKSIKISGEDVELAVEKARASRLDMITQVKQAFYAVQLAKEAYKVYEEVYDNAVENFHQTEMRYNVQKASELDYTRAKTAVANAIPNLYDAENNITMTLWQLKAVMGLDLDMDIDVAGELQDNAVQMFRDIHENEDASLENNTTMKQLEIQAEQLADAIKMQQFASLPTLSLAFAYSVNAMTNDFNFREYRWSPYSYVGLSLSIPIFAGGRRLNSVRQSKVQYEELKLQALNTERQLKIAIRQCLNQMETSMKSYDAAKEAEEAARKAYGIATQSFNLGRSTLTDLNDAQLALTQAQLGVSQAVYSFVLAKASLEQTLGKDFSKE
ncbi:MAG: TolC family protein [Bacteroidales bacterium]|nr:TolC family protein [Bacteroidales bacterium]